MEFQKFENEIEEEIKQEQNIQIDSPLPSQSQPVLQLNNTERQQRQPTINRAQSIRYSEAQTSPGVCQKLQNQLMNVFKLAFFFQLLKIYIDTKVVSEYQTNQRECCRRLNLISLGTLAVVVVNILSIVIMTYWYTKGLYINYGVQKPEKIESNFLHYSTVFCQLLGICYITVIFCMILCLCGVLIQHGRKQRMRGNILQNIKAMPFGTLVFGESRDCPVCLSAFNADDQIIQLKCHKSHIFHQECLELWIQKGNLKCPMCRVEIET
eukprot:403365058